MILAIVLLIAGFLITNQPTYAIDSPIQINPTNNTTVSSSKLTWQTPSYPLYSTEPYRIQVDNDSDFSSVSKDYKTKNTYYTPGLTDGIWYWRIKAKDSTGTWSDWSAAWSFILAISTPSPPATPRSTPTITPSPSSVPTLSFTITNIPSQINSDQSFIVSVNLTSNTAYYCKGAFKKADSSNYFGFTKVSGNWIKNGSSYSNQYLCANNFNLEVKPDVDDSGYTGSGDYIFKVGSYDQDGGNLTWSNEVTVTINNVNNDSSNDQSTPQPTSNFSSSASTLPTIIKSFSPKPTQSLKYSYRIASVAATTASATPSGKIEVKNEKQINPLVWIGLIFIFAGISTVGYIYLYKNAKIHIPFRR